MTGRAKYGAGMKRKTFTIPDHMADYLEGLGNGNASVGLRKAIERSWATDYVIRLLKDADENPTMSDIAVYGRAKNRFQCNPRLYPYMDDLIPSFPVGKQRVSEELRSQYSMAFLMPEEALIDAALKLRQKKERASIR